MHDLSSRTPRQSRSSLYPYLSFMVLIAVIILVRIFVLSGGHQIIGSVAILPLENLSGIEERDFFCLGMTEALITELSKISALRVISRQSILRYTGSKKPLPVIAGELGVDGIIEGTAMISEENVRITVQLVDARTNRHLWAESYERELTDIISLQREVAYAVAREIKVTVTPQEKLSLSSPSPVDPESYQLYLRGRYFWNKRTPSALAKGIDYFHNAIERDSTCALAHAGLADSYHLMASYNALPPHVAFPKAREAAMAALAIDETLAEAHTSLAAIKLLYDWDWPGAHKEFCRAMELNPNCETAHHWYAIYLTVTGQLPESIAEIERTLQLDPFSLSVQTGLARQYYYAKDYDTAITHYETALELDSTYAFARAYLGLAYVKTGRPSAAVSEFQRAVELTQGMEPGIVAALGFAHAVAGNQEEAREIRSRLIKLSEKQYVPAFFLAALCVGLGDEDSAFRWLEKAYADRSEWMIYLNVEHILEPIRNDPRFAALVEKVGLPL